MKALILIWSLLLPYMAFGQATSSDTQYRNDGETLINGSFEQGKKGYTLSVGSGSLVWSTQSTTSLNGKAMQLTLSAQTFSFKSATTQGSKLSGQNGYIEVYLSANNSGAEICPLVDGVSAPTTTPNECQPIIAGVGFKPYGIQKVFGATSLNYEIRGVGNASYTGVIYADDGSVAKKSIIANLGGYKIFGTLEYVQSVNCIWASGSATFINFTADVDCSTPNVTGSIKAPATKIPAFVLPSGSPSGTYYIVASGYFRKAGSTAEDMAFQLHDGTSALFGKSASYSGTTVGSTLGPVIGSVTYSTALTSDKTIQLQAQVSNAGTTSANIFNDTHIPLQFQIYYIPPQPISTINTSNGWFIDANIGGANSSVSGVTSSYSPISNTSLDLVINTAKGSAPAEIPCASGTASVGLTCNTPAVAENIGIVFTPPKTGKFKVCAEYAVSLDATNTGNTSTQATFQLVETSNTAVTIIQEGGSRIQNYIYKQNLGTGGLQPMYPNNTCGIFKFDDTSKKTIRLMYESPAVTNSVSIMGDRDAGNGQRDIHFTVEPIVENIQASLQSYTSTPNTINPKICAFGFGAGTYRTSCTSGTCTIYQQSSSCGVTVTRGGAGIYAYVFPANTWSGTNYFCGPVGLPTYVAGTHAPQQYENADKTNTTFSARFNNASGDSDVAANIICYGQGN